MSVSKFREQKHDQRKFITIINNITKPVKTKYPPNIIFNQHRRRINVTKVIAAILRRKCRALYRDRIPSRLMSIHPIQRGVSSYDNLHVTDALHEANLREIRRQRGIRIHKHMENGKINILIAVDSFADDQAITLLNIIMLMRRLSSPARSMHEFKLVVPWVWMIDHPFNSMHAIKDDLAERGMMLVGTIDLVSVNSTTGRWEVTELKTHGDSIYDHESGEPRIAMLANMADKLQVVLYARMLNLFVMAVLHDSSVLRRYYTRNDKLCPTQYSEIFSPQVCGAIDMCDDTRGLRTLDDLYQSMRHVVIDESHSTWNRSDVWTHGIVETAKIVHVSQTDAERHIITSGISLPCDAKCTDNDCSSIAISYPSTVPCYQQYHLLDCSEVSDALRDLQYR